MFGRSSTPCCPYVAINKTSLGQSPRLSSPKMFIKATSNMTSLGPPERSLDPSADDRLHLSSALYKPPLGPSAHSIRSYPFRLIRFFYKFVQLESDEKLKDQSGSRKEVTSITIVNITQDLC